MPITRITEKKEIKVRCIPANPVYLKWVGPRAWNFYCFGTNQVEDLTTTAGVSFTPTIDDLETADADSRYLTKTGLPGVTIGAENLDNDDIEGLKTLLTSPQVMLLVNPDTWVSDGEQWLTVKVTPAKYALRQTKESRHKFECIITKPLINLQSQ